MKPRSKFYMYQGGYLKMRLRMECVTIMLIMNVEIKFDR